MIGIALASLVAALTLQPSPVLGHVTVTQDSLVATALLRLQTGSSRVLRPVVFTTPQVVARTEPRVVCGMTILSPPAGIEFPIRRVTPPAGVTFPMRIIEATMCSDRLAPKAKRPLVFRPRSPGTR